MPAKALRCTESWSDSEGSESWFLSFGLQGLELRLRSPNWKADSSLESRFSRFAFYLLFKLFSLCWLFSSFSVFSNIGIPEPWIFWIDLLSLYILMRRLSPGSLLSIILRAKAMSSRRWFRLSSSSSLVYPISEDSRSMSWLNLSTKIVCLLLSKPISAVIATLCR